MLKIIFSGLVLLFSQWAQAADSCAAAQPTQTNAVFLGTGAHMSREAGERALQSLGSDANDAYLGQKTRFDLVHNKLADFWTGLEQAQKQAQAPVFSSQYMAWMNGGADAPTWFTNWYKDSAQVLAQLTPGDLDEQVSMYKRSIGLGQKVILVAYSQGDYHIGQAKNQLSQTIGAEKMPGFSTFQVAPSGLQAGDAHSLADGHLFISFDLRAKLLSAIKRQMDAVVQPVFNCSAYRSAILSIIEGTYETSCKSSVPLTIDRTGYRYADGRFVDMLGENVLLGINHSTPLSSEAGVLTSLEMWDVSYGFIGWCPEPPISFISKPVNIMKTMLSEINGHYQVFSRGQCRKAANGVVTFIDGPQSVYVEGTKVYFGEESFDLTENLVLESVSASRLSHDPVIHPGFLVSAFDTNYKLNQLVYGAIQGIESIAVGSSAAGADAGVLMTCNKKW